MRALRSGRAVRLFALVAVLGLVIAACGGDATSETTAGETPETTAAPETTTTTAATTTTTVVGECDTAFCVKYNIHPDAAWADGTAVTADDFAFTWEAIMDEGNDITSRQGYDQITGYEVVDEKTIVFNFENIYAPWQTLFGAILPKHELEGQPFNEYWDDLITLGSGPFAMTEWVKDERIVLTRNADYWASAGVDGSALGDVQQVVITFLEDSQTQVQALRGQEIDMFYPQPQVSLVEEVGAIEGVEWEAGLGPIWEHFDFNHDNPALQNLYVKQAIAQGINRDAIVEAIVKPIAANAEALGNSVWMTNSVYYEDHFNSVFPYDPVAAEAQLTDNGCTKGDDGIYVCDGERLSFEWATTAGNEGRELQFELAQADLKAIGIEAIAKFAPAAEVFSDENFYGDSTAWDVFNFAWVGSPDPAGGNTLYYCNDAGEAPVGQEALDLGLLNELRFCDPAVDELIRSTDGIVDPAERAAVYNEADALWLSQIPLIPMYQKPTFFAWNSTIQGPKDNATQIGPFWNIETWTGKETVIYGADQQPESMQILEPDGNLFAAGLIATAVLQGAFTVTPDFQYVPQLISSAEAIVPGS
ncbi:MAG: peptide ABC transporter substrate-binding protein [Acidimicrobiia bacterium]|nr:peptide ABC transporter substrate-binding protein [Acidimicrobiia bacterium]MDH5293879.1 peptide ABC transporter substrate-binding protein [Acidimicrobiia bacterium]